MYFGSGDRTLNLRGFLTRVGSDWGHPGGNEFIFQEPGLLIDGELELILMETRHGDTRRDAVPVYIFQMHLKGRNIRVGNLSLRVGATEHIEMYAGHIGYSVEPAFRGNRYAARACKLVFPLAVAHDLKPLWITCNPDNSPSRRTCELVGGKLIEIVPIPRSNPLYAPNTTWKCRYRVDL